MPLDTEHVVGILEQLADSVGAPRRFIVGFSGGRDSTVLLTLMNDAARQLNKELLAVHVNHGLSEMADAWQRHCHRIATELEVPFRALSVDPSGGSAGPEGSAREKRYAVLSELMDDRDWLLTAHHQDDQAETVLLHLMRGSGVSGLRAMSHCRPLRNGCLVRPLLDYSARELQEYAVGQGLTWIDDASNDDTRFDRNFLRREVLPLLASRWPAAARQLSRSALLAADAAELAEDLARLDIAACGEPGRLAVTALLGLSAARRANVVRHACSRLDLPTPPARQLAALMTDLLPARPDASPLVAWHGAEARRFRDTLYLLPPLPGTPVSPAQRLRPGRTLQLGAQLGRLSLADEAAGGIAAPVATEGLTVRFRAGGETLRPAGRRIEKPLKKWLLDAGIVPWMRGRVPLLYSAESLVAVADLWVADDYFADDGFAVVWQEKPPLA